MSDFKVGDKVRLKCCKRIREIICIDGPDVWLRCNDDDIPADEVRGTWELSDIASKVEPLPTPPEGDGWEWRKPVVGDEYQWLNTNGKPTAGLCVCENPKDISNVHVGYRWCRKARPKVRRFEHYMRISGSVHELVIPMIDDGTGPQLDTDKIVLDWLCDQPLCHTVSKLIAELRKERRRPMSDSEIIELVKPSMANEPSPFALNPNRKDDQ